MCNSEWMGVAVSLVETCRNLIYSVWMSECECLAPIFFILFIPSMVRKTHPTSQQKFWLRNLCTNSTYEKKVERMRHNLGKNTWEQFNVVSFSHFCSQSWAYLNEFVKCVWRFLQIWCQTGTIPLSPSFQFRLLIFVSTLMWPRIMSSQG